MSTQSAPTDFNTTRRAFMQGLSSPSIPPLAFKLAYLLAYRYANCKTQLCYPSQTTLASDLGVSIRTVQRLLDILERHGLVITPGDGRGRASTYWIDPERVTPVTPFPAQKGDKKGCHPTTKKGVTSVAPTKEENQEERKTPLLDYCVIQQGRGERDAPAARTASPCGGTHAPDGAAAAPDKQAPPIEPPVAGPESEDASRKRASLRARIAPPEHETTAKVGEIIAPADIATGFAALRQCWRRGHLSDETPRVIANERQAFARACAVAAQGEIITAAKAWIAAADAPRYLPPLTTWLDVQGWTKPPPIKSKRRGGNGGRRDDGLPRSNGFKVDLAQVMFKLGAER